MYRLDSPSKGEEDPFKALKTLALDLSSKYKTEIDVFILNRLCDNIS